MIHTRIENHHQINDQIRNGKVKIGKAFTFTDGGTLLDTEIIFWESLDSSNELSNLVIGNYVSISSNCRFIMGGNHRNDWFCQHLLENKSSRKKDEITSSGDIIIGNDVWIGYGAVILSGTTIPDGCVVGAMSVVKGNKFEPYDIIVGNPGKVVKKRFDKETIDLLLELKWWDWSDEDIEKYSDVLKSKDIEKLREIYKNEFNK
jgi:chloramphenicol O-acetyltransferase type B